jgi:hypothetical protein
MAQMASRASVEFYVGLALQGREGSESSKSGSVMEEAFVIRTFRNGVGVFVHRYAVKIMRARIQPKFIYFTDSVLRALSRSRGMYSLTKRRTP